MAGAGLCWGLAVPWWTGSCGSGRAGGRGCWSRNCCCKVFGISGIVSGTGTSLRGCSLIPGARGGLAVTTGVGAGEVSGGCGRNPSEVAAGILNTLNGELGVGWGAKTEGKEGPIMLFA